MEHRPFPKIPTTLAMFPRRMGALAGDEAEGFRAGLFARARAAVQGGAQ